jgi:enoyl-CoA hydratase
LSEVTGEQRGPEAPKFNELVFTGDGPVARIQLDRPEVINALSVNLSDELHTALDYVRDTNHLRVLVISGAGGNFCAGDDLTEMATGAWGNIYQTMQRVRHYQDMANTLEELDKITVASVDGWCVGGGLEITMACDFVICTERARWGMPEVDWGITPGWGGTTRMARLIGRRLPRRSTCSARSTRPGEVSSSGCSTGSWRTIASPRRRTSWSICCC